MVKSVEKEFILFVAEDSEDDKIFAEEDDSDDNIGRMKIYIV